MIVNSAKAVENYTKEEHAIELQGIKKHFVDKEDNVIQVIKDITLDIKEKEFISIIGPSGCGKSTMFNIISGLMEPSAGHVTVKGENISSSTGHVGYMMQKDLLFPWRTILDNVSLGLEVKGKAKKEREEIGLAYLAKYGLSDFANAYPSTLSGGMRQRVALIRTLAIDPDIILLDEPFSALDYQTRLVLEEEILGILRDFGKTAVLITHDIGEAIAMSDRVAVMTQRPTSVKKIYEVGLAKEYSSAMKARSDHRYNHFFESIWADLDIQIGREL
ncbi:ABC transporter ATP-binding protein [Bacillus canaveralius]|uniref:ABC transporter ATP-binding protein n=2 Tax=Bacillaceae TaxID=186817 RepID=A0A2N5GNF8_9BACI|nr:ABC transporter ATP-binding protein [Bacillus sp. V3-13]PLR83779.1 ABC transporter ATP-binding protein [Bacillus canaveralius]PLR86713.1 ABC transporter ATP-binding protein [Bacillus sp. V33-4]PLR96465.1 ABC transporter ATP-binding protein [Bacillus canaveralius]